MASDDFERQEVDRLVQELVSGAKPAPASAAPAPVAAAVAVEAPPESHAPTPGRRWSNVRLLMPALRRADRRTPLASFASAASFASVASFASAIPRPALPQVSLPALTDAQRHLISVRAFVGLGVLLSVSMAYWPYPKTYFWGVLLYLLAVSVVLLTGLWSAKLTWDARLGSAHTIALGIVLWATTLFAASALPLLESV